MSPRAAAIAGVLLVAACTPTPATSTTTSTPAPPISTTTAAPTTTTLPLDGSRLSVWGWASTPGVDGDLLAALDRFGRETGAVVAFEPQTDEEVALEAGLAGDHPPDAFFLDSFLFPHFEASGTLATVPEGAIADPTDFFPALRDVFTIDGTWYCPATEVATLALVYDPDALAAAGLPVPTRWEDLAAAATALTTDGGRVGLALPAGYARWAPFLFQAGAGLASGGRVTLDDQAARTALSFLAGLYASGSTADPSDLGAGTGAEAFGMGTAAMTVEPNAVVSYLRSSFPDRHFAVAPLPTGPAGPATLAFSACLAVPDKAADPQASWSLVDFLSSTKISDARLRHADSMPARQSAMAAWTEVHPGYEAFADQLPVARPWTPPGGSGALVGVFDTAARRLAAGSTTVDQMISEVLGQGNDLLAG